MIVIAKAADVSIQPRVLKVANKVNKLGYECRVVGIASSVKYLMNDGMENIVNVDAQLFKPIANITILRRLMKLVRFVRAMSMKRVKLYLVHDNLSLGIACFLKFFNREVKICYMGDELEIDRGFQGIKKYSVLMLMKYGTKKCEYLFQADNNRKILFERFTKRENIKVLRNVPERVDSFSPVNIRRDLNLPEDCLIFIYTGSISNNRGIENTMEALCMLSNHVNCCYLLIGWGQDQYIRDVETLIKKKKSKFPNFWGYIKKPMPMSELMNWSHSSDVGLSLIKNFSMSYYLGTPSKVYEYMMAGIPFITSNFPENRGVVEDTGAGILANPDSIDDIYVALKEITSDTDKMREMGKLGRSAALNKYNWEKESEILDVIFS